ncbi:MAG: hypothetical protein JWQ28_800 [Pedobacter sp.]|jgi:hypothetical protein|nr:hypothetical protein [Pedobacter sp.]
MSKRCISLLLLLTSFSILIGSCKKNEIIGSDISFISVYNASNNATSLNFLINGESIGASALTIGQKSLYYGVYEGVWSTEAIPSGTTGKTLVKDLTFVAGEHNSLFVIGPADSLDYFTIKDDINVKDPNQVKIKFLNLSPNAGSLNLEIALLGTVTSFPGLGYKQFSDYRSFNAGTIYTLTLKDSVTNNIVGMPVTAEFIQGKVYTVWAKGSLDATVESEKLGIQISELN